MRKTTEIYSIFGQIEEAAALVMIERGKGRRIDVGDFPDEVERVNEHGLPVRFALLISTAHLLEFENLIRDLRA